MEARIPETWILGRRDFGWIARKQGVASRRCTTVYIEDCATPQLTKLASKSARPGLNDTCFDVRKTSKHVSPHTNV
jgi:hypothetical protein